MVSDQLLDVSCVDRMAGGLESDDQRFADYKAAFQIGIELAEISFDIIGIMHFAEMFPNDRAAVFEIEHAKIRVDSSMSDEIDFALEEIINIHIQKSVGNEDLCFGADPFAFRCIVFGIRLAEAEQTGFLLEPLFTEFLIRRPHGMD